MYTCLTRWIALAISITTLAACGGGSSSGSGSSGDKDYSDTYGSYITLDHPTLGSPDLDYSTTRAWTEPGGGAEVPGSVDCDSRDQHFSAPAGYRITVTNTANDYSIEAVAAITCAYYLPTLHWSTYYPIPLEMGPNKLVARVTYPAEGISGQTTQIVTREPTTGPIVNRTYPEDEKTTWGVQYIDTGVSIYAVFDSEIDPASIGPQTFVVRDQNSVPVTGRTEVENFEIEYLESGWPAPHPDWTYSRITFTPDFPLPPLAHPAVTISGKIRDTAGREMGSDYNWSFHTGPY